MNHRKVFFFVNQISERKNNEIVRRIEDLELAKKISKIGLGDKEDNTDPLF